MKSCHWCGDPHPVDQLCQRAQRGMTRRSFCFLFGAGIAGSMLAPSLPEMTSASYPVTRVFARALDGGGILFSTRDQSLRVGRAITVRLNGQESVFTVEQLGHQTEVTR